MNESYAFFVDLDGTIFKWGTNELLPNAIEFLNKIKRDGHKIILTTNRGGEEWEESKQHPFNKENTLIALSKLQVPYDSILFEVGSPRIIVNDAGCFKIDMRKDSGFSKEYEGLMTEINTWLKIKKMMPSIVSKKSMYKTIGEQHDNLPSDFT